MKGSRYEIVSKDKVQSFVLLMEAMSKKLGSVSAACRYAGISHPNWVQTRNGLTTLSFDIAKKILAAHKRLKEQA